MPPKASANPITADDLQLTTLCLNYCLSSGRRSYDDHPSPTEKTAIEHMFSQAHKLQAIIEEVPSGEPLPEKARAKFVTHLEGMTKHTAQMIKSRFEVAQSRAKDDVQVSSTEYVNYDYRHFMNLRNFTEKVSYMCELLKKMSPEHAAANSPARTLHQASVGFCKSLMDNYQSGTLEKSVEAKTWNDFSAAAAAMDTSVMQEGSATERVKKSRSTAQARG